MSDSELSQTEILKHEKCNNFCISFQYINQSTKLCYRFHCTFPHWHPQSSIDIYVYANHSRPKLILSDNVNFKFKHSTCYENCADDYLNQYASKFTKIRYNVMQMRESHVSIPPPPPTPSSINS